MNHRHSFVRSETRPLYDRCSDCGTYRSVAFTEPAHLYTDDYWSAKHEHNTIPDHNHNVAVHQEAGLTKNDCVLQRITTPLRESALEIACAPGSLLNRLKNDCHFKRVIGVEIDRQYEADIAKLSGLDVELVFGWFPQATASFVSNSISLIIGLDVFEHVLHGGEFLAECRRLLKIGGELLLMLPLVSPTLEERFFHPKEHIWIYSPDHIVDLLTHYGFRDVRLSMWTSGHDIVTATKLAHDEC